MRIYYINLAHRTDRRASVLSQLSRIKLEATRIEAVTPGDLTKTDIEKYCQTPHYSWLSKAELSCSFSHIAALNQFLQSDDPHALILEDDVILSPDLKYFLTQFVAHPPALDILRLEATYFPVRLAKKPHFILNNVNLTRFFSRCSGAAAYIISRSAAKRIVAGDEIRFTQSDRVLFNPFIPLAKELLVLQAVPALCTQWNDVEFRHSDSDIATSPSSSVEIKRASLSQRLWDRVREFCDKHVRIPLIKFFKQQTIGTVRQEVTFKSE